MKAVRMLDTDVCIDVLRSRDSNAQGRLRGMGGLAVASVTVAELAYGAARSQQPKRDRAEVARLVEAMEVVDLGAEAAWQAGEIRAELAAVGTSIGGYDLLIAATARSRELVLVTRKVREFERVAGLHVEPW